MYKPSNFFVFRSWKAGKKMRNMKFFVDKTEALQKREIIFSLLKNEGLQKGENSQITEKEIDKMWD
jgi:hypothetical protein